MQENNVQKFIDVSNSSRNMAVYYLQQYKNLEVAIQQFFDDEITDKVEQFMQATGANKDQAEQFLVQQYTLHGKGRSIQAVIESYQGRHIFRPLQNHVQQRGINQFNRQPLQLEVVQVFDEQDLQAFMNVTDSSQKMAEYYLQQLKGNLENAVAQFFEDKMAEKVESFMRQTGSSKNRAEIQLTRNGRKQQPDTLQRAVTRHLQFLEEQRQQNLAPGQFNRQIPLFQALNIRQNHQNNNLNDIFAQMDQLQRQDLNQTEQKPQVQKIVQVIQKPNEREPVQQPKQNIKEPIHKEIYNFQQNSEDELYDEIQQTESEVKQIKPKKHKVRSEAYQFRQYQTNNQQYNSQPQQQQMQYLNQFPNQLFEQPVQNFDNNYYNNQLNSVVPYQEYYDEYGYYDFDSQFMQQLPQSQYTSNNPQQQPQYQDEYQSQVQYSNSQPIQVNYTNELSPLNQYNFETINQTLNDQEQPDNQIYMCNNNQQNYNETGIQATQDLPQLQSNIQEQNISYEQLQQKIVNNNNMFVQLFENQTNFLLITSNQLPVNDTNIIVMPQSLPIFDQILQPEQFQQNNQFNNLQVDPNNIVETQNTLNFQLNTKDQVVTDQIISGNEHSSSKSIVIPDSDSSSFTIDIESSDEPKTDQISLNDGVDAQNTIQSTNVQTSVFQLIEDEHQNECLKEVNQHAVELNPKGEMIETELYIQQTVNAEPETKETLNDNEIDLTVKSENELEHFIQFLEQKTLLKRSVFLSREPKIQNGNIIICVQKRYLDYIQEFMEVYK
ncbi:Hypothetical_protein [Hexamita inflata]|uniref:Hypothetical_protein n=1 Tax=Hexamita inflata TaxID=28002 RepID=A0AA86ND33_9EUKA|nr:Hypothetical protein HINF_LOCUS4930 [Hexamita inflata]